MAQMIKRKFRIVEKLNLNLNVIKIKVSCAEDVDKMSICSCVFIFNDLNDKRPYTPVKQEGKDLYFIIKIYESGLLSKFIDSKEVGDIIYISEFIKKRTITCNEFNNVLLIAGGTGITPIYQMIDKTLNFKDNETFYRLLFLNKTVEDIFLEEELRSLKSLAGDKLEIFNILDKGTPDLKNNVIIGRLNKEGIKNMTAGKKFEYVYICGPPSLMQAFSGEKTPEKEQGQLTGVLNQIGYSENNVYKF